jgi:phenylalanyl-tRNA synthetase alpha chain
MNERVPPIRIISAGKVFRNEATDATHEAEFHQLEGLCVDENVSMADLKNTLTYAFKKFFGDDMQVRFRASYFPFVKPGFEVDILWKDRWLEVCGGGLVHPEVLENGFKDNEKMNKDDIVKYKGFAFGMGLERLVMLKYGIDDIRDMSSGDVRFSRWF